MRITLQRGYVGKLQEYDIRALMMRGQYQALPKQHPICEQKLPSAVMRACKRKTIFICSSYELERQ